LNTVGLQRHEFGSETMMDLRRAYKIIYRQGLTVPNALAELKKFDRPEVKSLTGFIEASNVGIVR